MSTFDRSVLSRIGGRALPPFWGAHASRPSRARPPRLVALIGLLTLWLGAAPPSPAAPSPASAPLQIVYPRSESHRDDRPGYPLAVLHLALDRAGVDYRLAASAAKMQQSRGLALLESGAGIDIAWTVTTAERERRLRPIRFPIDRGLIGWRLLLIRDSEVERFAGIEALADLAALRGGQGHDWPDLALLRGNGLQVESSPSYEGLFRMLARGHIDYLPRSVSEVVAEIKARRELPIRIEPVLALHYPSALYFFVHRDNERLAEALERGLEAMLVDGSLQTAFDAHFADAIAQAGLQRRRVLTLANPLLSPQTPLQRAELWFDPRRTP
jgi:ABC-type amino acid transport substrate-binding protein